MSSKCIIPVIDLLDFPNQSSKLIEACEEWGCFRLLNYQQVLPAILMSEMKSLFDLPEDIKRRNIPVILGSGYYAKNLLNEALGVYDIALQREVDEFCSQLDATPHQREIIMRYPKAVHNLFLKIVDKLCQGLGVKTEIFEFENWLCEFRLNKYHFTPQSVGSLGLQIHTDSGFLTILQDDEDVDGLEVMEKSGKFILINPRPYTLLVNLGDMATVWSNGRFFNVKHRVQCKEAKIRVSIASFLLGPRETMKPPKELVDDDHSGLYIPTTYEEYRKLRFSSNWHAGEALALLHTPSFKK